MRSERATLRHEDGVPGVSGTADRPTTRRPARLTAGTVVPVVLGVLAAGFAYEALNDSAAMTSIVVARTTVQAGSAVNPGDTRLVRVHTTDVALTKGLLGQSAMSARWVAAVTIRAGEPVTLSEVGRPSSGPVLGEMSIAVPLQQAVGGLVGPGDRVDVIESNGNGGASYVAQDLKVLSVAPSSVAGGVLGGGGAGGYFVVVAVGKQDALRIAAALGSQGGGTGGAIEIVRSTGEPATSRTSLVAGGTGTGGTGTGGTGTGGTGTGGTGTGGADGHKP